MADTADDRRVLVVDDEQDLADSYAARLRESYPTTAVYSGERALQELEEGYDVMLLDRRMPGLSGEEVLAETRERGRTLRVVLVTAVDPEFDIIDVPYDDYVVKPVSGDDLERAVERALALARYNERKQQLNELELERNVREVESGSTPADEEYEDVTAEIEAVREELAELEAEIAEDFDLDDVELYL